MTSMYRVLLPPSDTWKLSAIGGNHFHGVSKDSVTKAVSFCSAFARVRISKVL